MELNELKLIKDFVLDKDETIRKERFGIAWDIKEHFDSLEFSLKIDLAKDIEKTLNSRCRDDWKVRNDVSESCLWSKDCAGIFLYRTSWVLRNRKDGNESSILIGLQAGGTRFNWLYACVKCTEALSPILKRALAGKKYQSAFSAQGFQIYRVREIENSAYSGTSNKEYCFKILTDEGRKAACEYYVDVIYRLKEELWSEVDREVTKGQ